MQCFQEGMITLRGKHNIGLLKHLTQAALFVGKLAGCLQTILQTP